MVSMVNGFGLGKFGSVDCWKRHTLLPGFKKMNSGYTLRMLPIVPRRLIALLLMLWFPLQGWAAVVMPLCAHGSSHAALEVVAAADMGEHCQHHAPAEPADTTAAQCDHCAACHLAHTPALSPQPLLMACDAPIQRAESGLVFYYLIFPEQPQRPPLDLV